jgi:hypothetical protein
VTAVLSTNATESTYLLQDSTGALEGFDIPFGAGSAPVAGDQVNLSGAWEPFHELPEIGSHGSITAAEEIGTTNNPLPAPIAFTTEDMQNGSSVGAADLMQVGNLDNVTFVETGTFSTANENSNEDFEVTDGTDIAQVFVSSSSQYFGTAIPTTPVDIHGYLRIFSSTPDSNFEYDLLGSNAITPVPEPASISLLGIGIPLLLRRRGRKD